METSVAGAQSELAKVAMQNLWVTGLLFFMAGVVLMVLITLILNLVDSYREPLPLMTDFDDGSSGEEFKLSEDEQGYLNTSK